jgi:hypothetical protein
LLKKLPSNGHLSAISPILRWSLHTGLTVIFYYILGEGPDAFFYVGTDSALPNEEGTLVPYPPGSNAPLGAFSKKNITLIMPDDIETSELRWLSVW